MPRGYLGRYNLDVMHIEKNVFDAIFGTLMDLKGKTKDSLNARKDIFAICDRDKIAVDPGCIPRSIPKAIYNLTQDQQAMILRWLMELNFPDGYASNFRRCVQGDGRRISAMKSHDCHVFMQRLLPVAFKEMLLPSVWNPITELSMLFKCLCSTMLDINKVRHLIEEAPVILCNLEKVFPPSFFNSMEHVVVHLPYEAFVGGPVQYRWMYPFERFLKQLKKTIRNKAYVEGSICQAYIAHETTLLVQNYAESSVHYRIRRPRRNDEGASTSNFQQFSIFNYPARFHGQERTRWLDENEKKVAHTYVLRNCPEVQPIVDIFVNYLRDAGHDQPAIDRAIDAHFFDWFKGFVLEPNNKVRHPICHLLAWGPSRKATSYPAVFINGYNFHTKGHGARKSTMNWGVCVRGSDSDDASSSFYGFLNDVLILEYHSSDHTKANVVLFDCDWFDPSARGMKVHRAYNLVDVNPLKKYPKYDPFVLAQQVIQVYYCPYPGAPRARSMWMAVCETKSRRIIEQLPNEEEIHDDDAPYQLAEIATTPIANTSTDTIELRDMSGINLVVDLGDIRPIEEHADDSEEEFDDDEVTSSEEVAGDDEQGDSDDGPNEF